MINRRSAIRSMAAIGALAASGGIRASSPPGVESSDLIYLSPHRSNGALSACQAEVWFQAHDDALFVVTAHDAWRARAVAQGLTDTTVWVGDVGPWRDSEGAYLTLPKMTMQASLERDPAVHAAVLEKMGEKYAMGWLVWGPRFRNGLADGSRVMLRYA